MNKKKKKIAYFINLVTSTPHWGAICVLQIVSGLASFMGLPLLMPVLEMMQGNALSQQASGYAKIFVPFLSFLGLELNLNSMLFLAAALMLLGQLLVNAASLVSTFVKEDLLAQYRKKIFDAYALVDWQWLTDHHSARMYHAIVRESEQACEVHMNAQRVLINFFQIAVYLLISFRLSWQITLLAIGIYVIVGCFNMINSTYIHKISEQLNQQFKHFSNDAVSFQHNKKFIKVALLGGRFLAAFGRMIDSMCALRKRQMLHVEIQRAGNVMTTSLLLIVLIFFHQSLSLNYATLLLVLFVFMRLAPQFVALSDVYAALDMNIPMHQSLQAHVEALDHNVEKNGALPYVPETVISLKNVRFAYPKQPDVLNDLSLVIKPKSMTALVGRSGSGKSTILDLMLGLLPPQSGEISYGAVAHDQLDKNSLRREIAFVSQRPSLLDGSLRENVAVAKPEARDEEILMVLSQVHLREFINQLPQGLDTLVGENGMKLSGGQRQRIALARCLLARPSILILDEATSELRSRMTIIMVAHRLSTVKPADTIYVIEQGRVCECGPYEELMAAQGRFFELASLQH